MSCQSVSAADQACASGSLSAAHVVFQEYVFALLDRENQSSLGWCGCLDVREGGQEASGDDIRNADGLLSAMLNMLGSPSTTRGIARSAGVYQPAARSAPRMSRH